MGAVYPHTSSKNTRCLVSTGKRSDKLLLVIGIVQIKLVWLNSRIRGSPSDKVLTTLAVEGHVFELNTERMRPNENLTVQVVPESERCQHELALLQYVKMTITDMHLV